MTFFNPSQSRVCITLSPSAVCVVRRGQEVARVPVGPESWEAAWGNGLNIYDEGLQAALKRAAITAGTTVDVEVHSPDAIADVLHLPLQPAEAIAAATLKVNDAINKPGGGGPVSVISVLVEAPDKAGGTNVFATAESSINAELISEWVGRAGLRLGAIRHTKALALLEAVTRVSREQGREPLAVFILEEHCAGLACASDGNVRFARSIDVGFDLLREAFERALGSDAVESARDTLLNTGIPKRDQIVNKDTGLRGDHVLPLLQPVIQRLAIELKQTLRFGLGETEIARVRVILGGFGSTIPGLAAAFTNTVDVPVDVVTDARTQPNLSRVNLAPHSARHRAERRALSAKMYVGCLAAGIAVAGHAFLTYRELQQTQASLRALAPQVDLLKVRRTDREELAKKCARVAQLEDLVASTVGGRPDWAVTLGEISRLSDRSVRLDEITGAYSSESPLLSLRGEITTAAGASTASLAAYLDKLTESAPFKSVQLGASKSARIPNGEFASFSLSASLRTLPPTLQAPPVAPEQAAAPTSARTQALGTESTR